MYLQYLFRYVLENTYNIPSTALRLRVQWYANTVGFLPSEGGVQKRKEARSFPGLRKASLRKSL